MEPLPSNASITKWCFIPYPFKSIVMFEYSVITPVTDKEQTFFIVPLADEEHFVNTAGAQAYESVRLDLMLEILNGYHAHAHGHLGNFETERYRYSRMELNKGMLAKVTVRK